MKALEKIGTIEAIALILIVVTNRIILNFPKVLIDEIGQSSWINVIFISLIVILFVCVILKIYKPFDGNILSVSDFLFGKWLKNLMGIIYILIFLGVISLILRDFSEKLKLIFLPQTPLALIILFFIIGAIYANKLGIKAIARTNLLIAILLFVGIFIIFTGVIQMMNINRIFPILGNGIKETFTISSSNLYAFTGIGYLYFIKPYLKKKEKINKIAIAGTVITAIYLFICILSFILVLPTKIISDNSFSIYFISRIVSLGNFLARIESLFVFSWILATLSYISISLFFALNIFGDITNIKDYKGMKYCFGIIILGLALAPRNFEQTNYLSNIFQIIIVSIVFILSFGIILLANLKQRKRRNNDEAGD